MNTNPSTHSVTKARNKALVRMGFEKGPAGQLAWLRSQGAVGDTISDCWTDFLIRQGFARASVKQMQKNWLIRMGFGTTVFDEDLGNIFSSRLTWIRFWSSLQK